jgi:trk system potassium uptake protein TrkA
MGDNAEALEFTVMPDFEFTGIPIKKMNIKSNVLIAGIIRESKGFIPGGDDVIKSGDKVIVISKGKSLCSLSEMIEGR